MSTNFVKYNINKLFLAFMNIKAFYSDPHFFHHNIIKYCDRPFQNIDEMNKTLIDNYNSKIEPNDTVIWLGDCFFKSTFEIRKSLLNSLNGHKILVLGNHDLQDTHMSQIGFDLVLNETTININQRICRLSHYPYQPNQFEKPDKYAHRRPKYIKDEILLHGHDHAKVKITGQNTINVGVDAWDYGPALYEEVVLLINNY